MSSFNFRYSCWFCCCCPLCCCTDMHNVTHECPNCGNQVEILRCVYTGEVSCENARESDTGYTFLAFFKGCNQRNLRKVGFSRQTWLHKISFNKTAMLVAGTKQGRQADKADKPDQGTLTDKPGQGSIRKHCGPE